MKSLDLKKIIKNIFQIIKINYIQYKIFTYAAKKVPNKIIKKFDLNKNEQSRGDINIFYVVDLHLI